MRMPIATDLKTRTTAPESKDARLKNCYAEIRGEQSAVRKRPIARGGVTTLAGQAQGGIGITIAGTDYLYTFNGDVSALNVVGFGTTWASGTSYSIGDVVSSGFVNYWATTAHTNSSPPSANWSTTYVPAVPKVYATWSNGSLTLSHAGQDFLYSSITKSSGKWYWEMTRNGLGLDDYTGDAGILFNEGLYGIRYQYYTSTSTNRIWRRINTENDSLYAGSAPVVGAVIGVALDCDNGTLKIFINGVNVAGGDTFVFNNGGSFGSAISAHVRVENDSLTANFGASAFSYSVPSGFNSGLYT